MVNAEPSPCASKRTRLLTFLGSAQYAELKALSRRTGLTEQRLLRQGLTDVIAKYARGRTHNETALRTLIHHLLEEYEPETRGGASINAVAGPKVKSAVKGA